MIKKKLKVLLLIFICFNFYLAYTQPTYADNKNVRESFFSNLDNTAKLTGHETYKELSVPEIAGLAIQMLLGFLGVIFLLLMIYGGYTWMMARGNDQQVDKAKKIIQNSIIGLIIVIVAYAITYFFMGSFNLHTEGSSDIDRYIP